MSDLLFRDLDGAGKTWVRYCLTSERQSAISRQALERSERTGGSVLGMGVPERANLPSDAKLQFAPETYGFLLNRQTSAASLLLLFQRIEQHYGPCFLVLAADLLGPGDPYIQELPPGSVVSDERDFYYIEPLSGIADARQFVVLCNSVSTGYPLVGFLLWGMTQGEIVDKFRRHDAGVLGDAVQGIVNSIFDNDAFSVWLPDNVSSVVLDQEIQNRAGA
jgi:hypothetical protein